MTKLGDIRFFNVTLRDGHLMCRPKHEPEFSFMGSLLQEIERANPEFAWVQMIFKKADYKHDLLLLKSDLHAFLTEADAGKIHGGMDGEQEYTTYPLKKREWYRRADAISKGVDSLATLPQLVMEIQGMWVGDREQLKGLHTFKNCVDETGLDSLAVFTYRDPRMLKELMWRRLAVDLGEYFGRYHGGGRMEPPSFLLATEDLPYYVHVPAGSFTSMIRSIRFAPPSSVSVESEQGVEVAVFEGSEVDMLPEKKAGGMVLLGAPTLPLLTEDFKEDDQKAAMLKQLASVTRRTLELVYDGGKTQVVLGAETAKDLGEYVGLLRSVYGGLDVANVEAVPPYIGRLVQELFPPETRPTAIQPTPQ